MINPEAILSNWHRLSPEDKRLIDLFMSPEANGRRYALGRNEHSAALSAAIEIDYFIDDFAEPDTVWNGKPVIKGNVVPRDAIIINCSMSIRPITAHKRAESLNTSGVLSYTKLCAAFPNRFPLPDFVLNTRMDIESNTEKWKSLSGALSDSESKQVLDDILGYRLTGDYNYMKPYLFRPQEQYFEDFLHLDTGEVFVDAGGYDGDTAELFCTKAPNYKKVFFFEPSLSNYKKAESRLSGCRSIEMVQLGLSDSEGSLWFNSEQGSASVISDSGTSKIDVIPLDQYTQEKVTFIKMDLEGWELKALQGSVRHIQNDHPKLAIAVYHHPSDFWRIFEFISETRKDYNIFLRHYTEGWSETVMYFVPR